MRTKKVAFSDPEPNFPDDQYVPKDNKLSDIESNYRDSLLRSFKTQSKKILKVPVMKESTQDTTFLTGVQTDSSTSVPLKQSQSENKLGRELINEIIVPPLPTSLRLNSLGSERRSKTNPKDRESPVKLPPIRHSFNPKSNQVSRENSPAKKKERTKTKSLLNMRDMTCSSSTRDLMGILREDILEKHAEPKTERTERLEREKIWERQDEIMNRLNNTRDTINSQKKFIERYMERHYKLMIDLEKKHYDPIYRSEGIKFIIIDRPIENHGAKFYTVKKNGALYSKRRLASEAVLRLPNFSLV